MAALRTYFGATRLETFVKNTGNELADSRRKYNFNETILDPGVNSLMTRVIIKSYKDR